MSFVVEHQIELSATLIGAILLSYQLGVPGAAKFVEIQGPLPPAPDFAEPMYRNSRDDAYLVVFGVLLFTLVRAAIMKYLLGPLGRHLGVVDPHKMSRFCEQLWLVIYSVSSVTASLLIMSELPHWFHTPGFWEEFPHIAMTRRFKLYYLMAMSFWLQQFFVLQVEERRKDYWQMLCHHIVTCALLLTSYTTHYTRIGNATLATMDFADIFLSGAKVLGYIGLQRLCDITFVIFVFVWIATRHIIFGILIWSTYFESPVVYDHPRYNDPTAEIHYSRGSQFFFLSCFAILQTIIIYWFVLIIKIVIRVLRGDVTADNRSSGESDDEEPAKAKKVD
ncbi:Sphingosine N-acyltransferase lag1 [Tieghemiomyces parasiticus]|uniref:Sphingosine N-acyltransferase lag1 n=1 Tax=Tieghemiomyces parasiticus TaxID=78921 RepID=A0A9W8DXY1_9FUNG|nr:Sphingosine N-acyltransferase lag1 [Tieghemiomyces parasiticus]